MGVRSHFFVKDRQPVLKKVVVGQKTKVDSAHPILHNTQLWFQAVSNRRWLPAGDGF